MSIATEVKERPILFSGPMVRAILEGRKTQTRRVVKLSVPEDADDVFMWCPPAIQSQFDLAEVGLYARKDAAGEDGTDGWLRFLGSCPYGQPGDRLWVRETWQQIEPFGYNEWRTVETPHPHSTYPSRALVYSATPGTNPAEEPPRWRPSIHMPYWASRLSLEVTDVRVERLQEITPGDIKAEGFPMMVYPEAISTFSSTWDELNANRGFPWESNPWVWVVAFKQSDE